MVSNLMTNGKGNSSGKMKIHQAENLKLVLLSNKKKYIKVHHQNKEFLCQFVIANFPNNASNINPVQMSIMDTNIA